MFVGVCVFVVYGVCLPTQMLEWWANIEECVARIKVVLHTLCIEVAGLGWYGDIGKGLFVDCVLRVCVVECQNFVRMS